MGSLNKKASGAQCFIMALGLFWDIATGLPWTPNGAGSLEPKEYCIFLPGAHYLTINSPNGADSSLNKLLLLLLPIKQRIDYKLCILTYKTLTNQQPTYLYNSLSFPSHSVFTRSSDSLVLSIPYVRSSLGKRAFSVIGPSSMTLEFTTSRYPKFEFFTKFPFQAQNTPLQNCIPSLGSFPSPWTVYPDFDSCYSHFMPYRMTPTRCHLVLDTGL